jgi:anti-TRAP (tryptophan RNA-binding attenuator protein) protein/uncharacterized protein DUF551
MSNFYVSLSKNATGNPTSSNSFRASRRSRLRTHPDSGSPATSAAERKYRAVELDDAMSDWIKVSDRKPERGQYVAVCNPGMPIAHVRTFNGGRWDYREDSSDPLEDFTLWQPMPTPPKGNGHSGRPIQNTDEIKSDDVLILETPCEECGGTGRTKEYRGNCITCNGKGFVITEAGKRVLALMQRNLMQMLKETFDN